MLRGLNLAVRFLLELCALAALAYWGSQAVTGAWRYVLAVAAPLAFALAWGLFASPKARFKQKLAGQLMIEAVLFGLAALALGLAGRPGLAVAFAALVVVNRGLITAMGQSTGG